MSVCGCAFPDPRPEAFKFLSLMTCCGITTGVFLAATELFSFSSKNQTKVDEMVAEYTFSPPPSSPNHPAATAPLFERMSVRPSIRTAGRPSMARSYFPAISEGVSGKWPYFLLASRWNRKGRLEGEWRSVEMEGDEPATSFTLYDLLPGGAFIKIERRRQTYIYILQTDQQALQ